MTNTSSAETVPFVSRPTPRRFTLFDAMALIAATAVGVAFIRYSHLRYFAREEPAVPDRLLYHTLYTIDAFCSPRAIDTLFMAAGAGAMPAVLAVCLVRLLCGLWNPVPEWPDRLGRVLGYILLLWMLTPH